MSGSRKGMLKEAPLACANAACRAMFRPTMQSSRGLNGSALCPKCTALVKKGRGDLLDPKLYALCQKVAKAEARYDRFAASPTSKQRRRSLAAKNREAIRRYERRMPGEPLPAPLGEAYLNDGYAPTANSGKRAKAGSGREG